MKQSYQIADEVLKTDVIAIAEIITRHDEINVDFADVTTILKGAGRAHIAIGHGEGKDKENALDLMLYLWEGARSPLFHKDKMTTFERYFIDDKDVQAEENGAYYTLANERTICEKILQEFGLDPMEGRIINGHIPVRTLKGESPMRAEGKRYVIDGGFSKPYQKKTGIAGYTLIYNSHGIQLVQHEMFESREQAIMSGSDIHSRTLLRDFSAQRIRVRDTDKGKELLQQVSDLKKLLEAYQNGIIKEAE